jgi:hypothetical protein
MGSACSTHGAKRNAYKILMGTLEGKRPPGRSRHMWEDNIKMSLREIGWGGMDWSDLAQDRDQWRALVNTVMNLRIPSNFRKFLSGRVTGGFSRRTQLHGVRGALGHFSWASSVPSETYCNSILTKATATFPHTYFPTRNSQSFSDTTLYNLNISEDVVIK